MNHPARESTLLRIALLSAATASLLLAGCDDDDSAARALQTASMKLESISGGGASTAPWTADRLSAYAEIVADLGPALESNLPGEVTAARLIKSRALAGQAQAEAEKAAVLQRGAGHKSAAAWSALDRYLSSQALSMALEEYDPEPAFAEIAESERDRDEAIAAAWAAKKKVDDAIADLEQKAQAALSRAQGEREQESRLRAQAGDVSATEAASIIEQAAAHRRAADGHDVEAARLGAQATNLAPQSTSAQAEIDKLTAQKQLLVEARQEIESIATVNRDKAKDAHDAALEAAADVTRLVDELVAEQRAIEPEVQKAAGTLKAAATEARQAASGEGLSAERKSGAKLAEASRLHALADVLAMRASGLRSHAALLSALAEAAPSLPDDGKLATTAEQAGTEAQAAVDAAKEAYEAAKSAYDGAGGRGADKERLDKISAGIDRLANPDTIEASRTPFPVEGEEGDTVAVADDSGDATPADEATSQAIRDTLGQMIDATESMDVPAIFANLHAAGDTEAQLLRDGRSLLTSGLALDAACKEKYGQGFLALFKASPMGASMGSQFDLSMLTGQFAKAREELDSAPVMMTGPQSATIETSEGEPLEFVKTGGAWKVLVKLPDEARAQVTAFAPMIQQAKTIIDETTTDVKDGKYPTPDVMFAALFQKAAPLMQQMQGMGPGGG